jgi:hypothetical protein
MTNRIANSFFTVLGVLLALSAPHPARGASSYSTSVTSATSLTISAATSGMTSPYFGVYLIDSNNVKRPTSEFSGTIDQSTYSVSITFNPAFTGTVKLRGLFPGSDTAHSYDFRLTAYSSDSLQVCDGCVDNSTGYAKRSYNGIHYVSTTSASVSLNCASGWYFAYILDNQLYVAATNDDTSCMSNPVNLKMAFSSTGYPAGAVPLGIAKKANWDIWQYTDDRPF